MPVGSAKPAGSGPLTSSTRRRRIAGIDLMNNHGVSIRDPDDPDIPHLVDPHPDGRGIAKTTRQRLIRYAGSRPPTVTDLRA